VDIIVKDVERQKDPFKNASFNFRAAHRNLSFPQLLECAKQAPELFRDNSEYAVRGMQLLRAAAEVDTAQCADLRNEAQREKELHHIATYLEFLRDFTPEAVDSIRLMVFYRKLELLNVMCWTNASAVAELLNSLVGYVKIAGGRTLGVFHYVGSCGFHSVSQMRHEEILEKSLKTLWSSGLDDEAVFNALRAHLEANFLDIQHALTMIKLGKGDFAGWTAKLKDNGQDLSSQASSSQVVFCESNLTYFLPEDPLRIFVRTRNVKTLTAHLYEIKTLEYYSRLRREIKGDICLDGLLPTEEQVVDLSSLSPWQESRVPIEFRSTKNCQRGVFVVEVFEKGMTCRAILRRGFLRYVERITTHGHEFTVLDERGNGLHDASALILNVKSGGSRAQHGREYTADENGNIVVPFRHPNEATSSDKWALAFCQNSFADFHGSFDYLTESFDINVDMHIDAEQLLPGCLAQLITRPRLLVSNIATGESLDLVVDVKLVIEFGLVNTSNVGSSSHKEVLSFASLQEIVIHPPCFEIPMDAKSFSVTLEARVSRSDVQNAAAGTNELLKVSSCKSFEVQRVNNFDTTYTGHLIRKPIDGEHAYSPSAFSVLVLGHNGEPVPNAPTKCSFRHAHSTDLIKVDLQTDSSGEIKLGQLQDVMRLGVEFGARTGSSKACSWELPNLRSYRPQIVNCSVEEVVEIPIPFAFSSKVETWIAEGLVSVCEVVDTVLQSARHCSGVEVIKNEMNCPVSIAVRIRRTGKYLVYLRPLALKYPVSVCEKKRMHSSLPVGLIVQPTQVILSTRTLPLTICSQALKKDSKQKVILEIRLRNASITSTHLMVQLKHFLDVRSHKVSEVIVADSLSPVCVSGVSLPKLSFQSAPLENDYLKMRKISDEYAYILRRRAIAAANQNSILLIGSTSLPKPTLLQNPHVVCESDMEVVNVEAGDKVTGFKNMAVKEISSSRGLSKKSMQHVGGRGSSLKLKPSISFLGQQSQLVASTLVSSDGIVCIELSDLPFFTSETGPFEVCTMAFDSESGYVCTQELTMVLPGHENRLMIPKRDTRLSVNEALSPSEHFHQVDSHECVHPGEVKTLPRSFSSKYALYESMESAINLWPTLTREPGLEELADKLKAWWKISPKEKNRFYYSNACDDLHFYLFRKDRDFFRQSAEPLIAAKICKSLMDYYVLGDEASLRRFYLDPAAFQRLSCVEKVLVAERMSDTEVRNRICRAVIREIESSYPSGCTTALARVFNTVLSQGQVEPTAVGLPQSHDLAPGMAFGAPPPPPGASDLGMPRMAYAQQSYARAAPAYSPTSPAYSPTSPAAPTAFGFGASAAASFGSTGFAMAAAQPARPITETTMSEVGETMTESYVECDDDFGVRSLDSASDINSDDGESSDGDDPKEENKKRNKNAEQESPYIPPGKVRKVQEKRYFTGQRPALTGSNMFWKEYAEHILRSEGGVPPSHFVSSYFPEALGSITEGLFTLAVLDLDVEPMSAQVQLSSSADTHVTLSPTSTVVLYHRSIGPAQCSPTANSVLILKQRIQDEHGDSNTELLVNKVYTTVVTVSNIGSDPLVDVNLLVQIPHGALPMGSSGFYTKNEIASVPPNHTSEFSFCYYFPEAGSFAQYPARASVDGLIVGWANLQDASTTCNVVRSATRVNLASWSDVSARGSLQEVLHFMESAKADVKIDYQQLLWRCHDENFFLGLVGYLKSKMIFVAGVWKYGLLHREQRTMREFFASSSDLIQSVGSGFCSSFVDERHLYRHERFASAFDCFDHCEFGPFLTRRVHPVTGRVDSQASWGSAGSAKTSGNRILNAEARKYFGELCQRLGTHTRIENQYLLVMAYYMILFDRINDAIAIFRRLEAVPATETMHLRSTVQYAYLAAFLDFFGNNGEQARVFAVARQAITRYAEHPQPRWRQRFRKMQEFVEEYDTFEVERLGRLEDMEVVDAAVETAREDQGSRSNATRRNQVKLEATIGDGAVTLLSQSLGQCELAFYPIDVELMFSTEPFNTFSDSAASASSLLLVQPRHQQSVTLRSAAEDSSAAETIVSLPYELRAAQMMIRVREIPVSRTVNSVAPPIDIIRPYFNSSLVVDVMTQCGILQVLSCGMPVRSCYVKVYAKVSSGGGRSKTEFFKDGYTDLLGKFDYVGINGDLISSVQKFSILVSHDKYGATVEQTDPPVLAATVGDFSHKEERELLLY